MANIQTFCKEAGFTDVLTNFLCVTAENGRMKHLKRISSSFDELMMASRNEVKATVTSAETLSAAQLKNIVDALAAKWVPKGTTLKVETGVDADILGGFTVSLGEQFIDLSLATRIKQVEDIIAEPIDYNTMSATPAAK